MPIQMKLQHSESVVAHVASRIYAAYITTNQVGVDEQSQWIQRSIREAIELCHATDDEVISDDEVGGLGAM